MGQVMCQWVSMGTEILTTLRGKKGLRDGSWKKGLRDGSWKKGLGDGSWKKGDFRDGP